MFAGAAGAYSRPIGANQGIQFPIAEAFAQTRAAALMVDAAARRYEAGEPAGAEANMVRRALVHVVPAYRKRHSAAYLCFNERCGHEEEEVLKSMKQHWLGRVFFPYPTLLIKQPLFYCTLTHPPHLSLIKPAFSRL